MKSNIFNLPNCVTYVRLVLTIVMCCLALIAPSAGTIGSDEFWELESVTANPLAVATIEYEKNGSTHPLPRVPRKFQVDGNTSASVELATGLWTLTLSEQSKAVIFWYNLILILFTFTAITDWLDGYLARKYNQETQIGRILDPVVDKTLVFAALLIVMAQSPVLLPFWVIVICLIREFVGTGLRTAVEARGQAFGAQGSGKAKTMVQFFVIGWFFMHLANAPWIVVELMNSGRVSWEQLCLIFKCVDVFFVAGLLFFVLYSLVDYTAKGIKLLQEPID